MLFTPCVRETLGLRSGQWEAVPGVVAYINSTALRLLNLWKWLVILEVDRDLN